MKILKNTISISCKTLKEIDAKIVLDNNKVYVHKSDEESYSEKNLLDTDFELYNILSKRLTSYEKIPPAIQMVYVSSKCNLECDYCYEESKSSYELSVSQIEALAKRADKQIFVLIGKEPTCREDLFLIIKTIKKYDHYVQLATNGIKLSDRKYVASLKKEGLDLINFSINSFDNLINEDIHHSKCVSEKMKALSNIKYENIKTSITMILIRGKNEHEISQFLNFCIINLDYIKEFRMRSCGLFNKNSETNPLKMSEILLLILKELNIRHKDVINEYLLWKKGIKYLKLFFPRAFKYYSQENRICTFSFYINKEKKLPGLYKKANLLNSNFINIIKLVFYWLKYYSLNYLIKHIENIPELKYFKKFELLTITINCWPNIHTFDKEENNKCISVIHRGDKKEPFCLSNILNNCRL